MYPPGLLSTCQNARMSARVLGTQVKSGAINLLTVPSSAVIRVVKGTSYVLGPMVYSRDRPNVHSMYVFSCLCLCLYVFEVCAREYVRVCVSIHRDRHLLEM